MRYKMYNAKHIISSPMCEMGFPKGSLIKNLPAMQETGSVPGLRFTFLHSTNIY